MSEEHQFLLQRVQPAMVGLIDRSLSTLAPIFGIALATHNTRFAFVAGLVTALGAAVSMGFSEGPVDFYASLGVEEHFRLGAYAGLRRGVYELAVVSSAWPVDRLGAAVPAGGPAFELYVYVDDVDATVAALRASGVRVLRDSED